MVDRLERLERLWRELSQLEDFTELANNVDGLLIVDFDGNIIDHNRKAREIFGYEHGELDDKPLSTVIPARFHAHHDAAFNRYVATGERKLEGKIVIGKGLKKGGDEITISIALGCHRKERKILAVIREVPQTVVLE